MCLSPETMIILGEKLCEINYLFRRNVVLGCPICGGEEEEDAGVHTTSNKLPVSAPSTVHGGNQQIQTHPGRTVLRVSE